MDTLDPTGMPVAYAPEPAAPVRGLEAFFMHQDALRLRLLKVSAALDAGRIPYALIGGNAVAHYVSLVDPDAVRSTADVDLIMREEDVRAAEACLKPLGFKYRKVAGVHMFLDTPSARSGVHIVMAGKRVRPEYAAPAPDLDAIVRAEAGFAVIPFSNLVVMKLTSYRDKDRTHLRDMIGVGLLPGAELERLPPVLRERLQYLLDHPED